MTNKKKKQSRIAAFLCLMMLMIEVLAPLCGAGQAFAAEDMLNAVPMVEFSVDGETKRFSLSTLHQGYLKGLDNKVFYDGNGVFTFLADLDVNISVNGGAKCKFNLQGHTLTGTEDTATFKIAKRCEVEIYTEDPDKKATITSSRTRIEDEAGIILNKGILTARNLHLGGVKNKISVTRSGAGIRNVGTALLDNVEIYMVKTFADGGAIYNSGTLTISSGQQYALEVRDCEASRAGHAIYNESKALIKLDGAVLITEYPVSSQTEYVVNAGTIGASLPLSAANLFIGNIKNTDTGVIEAGIFDRKITGGTIKKESGNVKLRFQVNTWKTDLCCGQPILAELKKTGCSFTDLTFPDDGGRKVTDKDLADAGNLKTRQISGNIGVLVEFETNCETKIASQIVSPGTTVKKPSIQREGYHDPVWCEDAALTKEFDFSKPIEKSTKLYAKWIPIVITPVKLTFDTRGGSEILPQVIQKGDIPTRPEDPVKEGYALNAWMSKTGTYYFTRPLEEDTTIYAEWSKMPDVVVSYDDLGGSVITRNISFNACADGSVKPKERQEAVFTGWFSDKSCTKPFDFSTRLRCNTTLYAGWKDKAKYTVQFDSQGGSAVEEQTVHHGEKAVKPADPVKADCQFCGWYTDSKCTTLYDFNSPVTKSMTLYALWMVKPVVPVWVSFESNGGTPVGSQVLAKGQDRAIEPKAPTRQYYNFVGWYSDRALTKRYDFSQVVNEDLTLYAAWDLAPVIPVKVSFVLDAKTQPVVQTVMRYETVEEPAPPTSKTAFFTGWYENKECTRLWNFNTPVETDLTLYAGWKAKQQFEVSFDTNYAGGPVAKKTVLEQDKATEPTAPVREHYLFCGWCTDKACKKGYNFELPVTGNMTLYARWLEEAVIPVRVSYESNGGSKVAEEILAKGDAATKPEDPVRELYIFAGWYADKQLTKQYDFTAAVTEDITLYAQWFDQPVTLVHVTYDYQDGSEPFVDTIFAGDAAIEPEGPLREEYFFTGWYEDRGCSRLWDFSKAIYENKTLYAGWVKKPEYTVSFESNGGSEVAPKKVLELNKVEEPAPPTKAAHTFLGWCEDKKCTRLYEFDRPVTENLTLYACWILTPLKPVRVRFETNGGSSVPEQLLNQGDKAVRPADPTREYYAFTGWFADPDLTEPYDFGKTVQQDMTLYAGWNLKPVVVVTVTFDKGTELGKETQTLLRNEKAVKPADPVRRTHFFTGWYADKSCSRFWDFDTPVEKDTTIYAGWKEKKIFTVSFESNGGSKVDPAKVYEQDPVAKPSPDPTRKDHIFIGWCSDAACKKPYDFTKPVTRHMTLYARWLEKSVIPVKVSYESNGGSAVPTETLACGDRASKPEDPVRECYSFAGWYTEDLLINRYDFNEPVTEDTVLYAKWLFNPVSKVTVTFSYQDGRPDKVETVLYRDTVPRPEDPLREEYFFTGWYEDEACTRYFTFDTPIIADITLYAGWRQKKTFTVSFDTMGGTPAIEALKVREMDLAQKPAQDPAKTGKLFCGWTIDSAGYGLYDFNTPVTEDLTLYALWLETPVIPVTVSFDSKGGSKVLSQIVASGSTANRPADPVKERARFVTWIDKTGKTFDFTEKITDNITLFAKWLEDVIIPVWLHFDTRGAAAIDPQLVASGSCATRPAKDPVRENYHFTGWYADTGCLELYDFDDPMTEDRIVYAGWKPYATYTFRFESNGGSSVASQTVTEGNCAVKPEDPTRAGYTFMFWCVDQAFSQVYDFTKAVTEDTTVYARWKPNYLETVIVHFDSNGGTPVEDQKVGRGEKVSRPPDPVRSSYRFDGWYSDQKCSTLYDFQAPVTAEMTLYAGWTYRGGGGGGGGSSSGGGSYTMNTLDAAGNMLGTWVKNDTGWWIQRADGTWPKDEWVQCTWQGILNWYHFNAAGYMETGFITDKDGKRYYLYPEYSSIQGAMATGWVLIEGKWYYFETESNGYRGSMYVNTKTPDGYTVGADGVWTGK